MNASWPIVSSFAWGVRCCGLLFQFSPAMAVKSMLRRRCLAVPIVLLVLTLCWRETSLQCTNATNPKPCGGGGASAL